MKYFLYCLLLLALPSVAAPPELKKISLSFPPNGDMVHLKARDEIAVSGFSQFDRWLSIVDLTHFTSTLATIPEDAQFFNQALLVGSTEPQLVFLGLNGISKLSADYRAVEPVVAALSIYRVLDQNRLREADFVVQLGSGVSDFLLPDFQVSHLYRQQADGSFRHYALQIPALVQSWRGSPDYSPRKHYIVDVDQDGLPDLLFVWQGKFQVFFQQQGGSFSTAPVAMNWPVSLSTEQEADQRNDAGRSYSGQNIDTLRDITDIDGDGVVDLVINREQLADALERNNSFRIYFGQKTPTGLTFSAEADTSITTDTSPIDVVIDDINNDGRKDFYIPSTHFGVGTIIRVLLRGSANLDIDFYLLNTQRKYSSKADFRQQATIEVSISNFRYDMPLFQLVDADGSGRKSLYVGDGQDGLRSYVPDSKRLFSRKSERFKFQLPRDARKVKVFDIDGNSSEDLVLPFDALEEKTLSNQLHFILN